MSSGAGTGVVTNVELSHQYRRMRSLNTPCLEVAALYSEDSVADYIAEPVVVNLPGDIRVPAVCYNLPAARLAGTNSEYAAALLTLATRLGLPESYLRHIRQAAAAS